MVNNAVNVFEKEMIVLDPTDFKVVKQLEDYSIKKLSTSGKPTYVDQNEHIVDCICLALLGFEQQYGELFNIAMSARIIGLSKNIDEEVNHRIDAQTKPRIFNLIGTTNNAKSMYAKPKPIMRSSHFGPPSRSNF